MELSGIEIDENRIEWYWNWRNGIDPMSAAWSISFREKLGRDLWDSI